MNQSWIKTLLHFAKSHRYQFISATLFSIISVCSGIIPFIAGVKIISGLLQKTLTAQTLTVWLLIKGIAYLLKTICYAISTVLSHQAAYNIIQDLRIAISQRLLKSALGVVNQFSSGTLKNAIMDRTESIEIPLAHFIPEFSANVLLVLIIPSYLLTIDYRLALAVLVSVPLAAIPLFLLMRNFGKKYDDYMAANRKVNNVMVSYVEGIEVIKTFNQSGKALSQFKKAVLSFKDYTLDWLNTAWKSQNLIFAILPTTLIGSLPVGLTLYLNKTISLNQLLLTLLLAIGLGEPLNKLSVFANDFKAMKQSITNTQYFLNLPILPFEEHEVAQPQDASIEIKAVDFGYLPETKVLRQINLTIPNHQFYAIVGPSGSGKSTLIQLISRFWDVTTGSIRLGGVDLKQLTQDQLNQMISYVTQDSFLFKGTIEDNIRMGNPGASDEEVIEAAKASNCLSFIQKMPQGIKTELAFGNNRLSGGQQQRLSIARAFLKQAPILILDEPTASMDPENELKIQMALANLAQNKTVLMVSHRLATIQHADKIIVLDNGCIAESGSHEELLKQSGTYEKLWKAYTQSENWHVSSRERTAY
ncbi:MAG: ABC transporter ATP-binding protein [Lactobacillus sp.]